MIFANAATFTINNKVVNCESKLGLAQRPYLGDAHIAYRILLTIPVIVASAERSFSKLKLIKSYLRSTMS